MFSKHPKLFMKNLVSLLYIFSQSYFICCVAIKLPDNFFSVSGRCEKGKYISLPILNNYSLNAFLSHPYNCINCPSSSYNYSFPSCKGHHVYELGPIKPL
jgi:hypothetical protein